MLFVAVTFFFSLMSQTFSIIIFFGGGDCHHQRQSAYVVIPTFCANVFYFEPYFVKNPMKVYFKHKMQRSECFVDRDAAHIQRN